MESSARVYPAATLIVLLAAALLVPSLLAPTPDRATLVPTRGSATYAVGSGSEAPMRANGAGAAESGLPFAPQNANLITDGTFDSIPGPWTYTNGTTRVVTAERDASARARLGARTLVLRFDSMDNISGPNPWVSVIPKPGDATSNLSQSTAFREEGSGSLRDDVMILQNGNKWGGAVRNDPVPWNWTGYDRMAIRMNKATPTFVWGWLYAQDVNGGTAWGFFTLVAGWYRYAFDLNTTLDASAVDFLQVAFSGPVGTPFTVYVDDIVLYNSTAFAEDAGVAQTFFKPSPTGGSPNSLSLSFDVAATSSLNVVSYLQVAIDGTTEWSETPVASGTRRLSLDVSGNVALQGTGSFTLAFSLRLNRTGWEESSMTAWIDNVTLSTPGAVTRIVVSPPLAFVPVGQSAVFTAQGRDADGNPVSLTATNWSSTIGQIVAANATSATFRAPTLPGTGIVSASQGTVTGTANVTIDPWGTPRINGVVPDQVAQEDAASWAIDLTPYATNQSDPSDTLDNLEWYLETPDTNLYTVFGEKTFGRHDLVFTPRPDAFGSDNVTLWLEDRDSARSGQALRIAILPVDDPPVFVAVPEIRVAYNEAYRFDFRPYVRDIDTPFANLTLTTDDSKDITVDGLNATYLYGWNFNGKTLYVRHYVSDGTSTAVAIVTVRVTDNSPPRLNMPLPDLTFPEDTVVRDAFPDSLRAYFDDREGTQLFFSYNFTHLIVWINDTGTKVTVDVTGLPNFFGEDRITFRGTDPSGAFAEYTVSVDVTPVNDPPVLAWTDDVYVPFNQTYRLDLTSYVSDVDNATNELRLTTSDPQGAAVAVFVITFFYPRSRLGPAPEYIFPLTLTLSDGLNSTARTIDVHVSNNHPPELVVPLDPLSFNEDEVQHNVIYLNRHFVDVDGERLRYTGSGRNVSVSIASDKVTLTPDPNWFGQEVVVFRAADPEGAFALGYLVVDVLPVNDAPVFRAIPDQVRSDGGPWILDLRPYVTDVDTDLSQIVFSTDSPNVEVVGFLLVFHFPDSTLLTGVTVTAYDSGLSATTVVTIRITSASPWGAAIWPGLSFLAAALTGIAVLVIHQSQIHRFRIDDLFLIKREGLLIAHARRRGDPHGDEDILAGMLTAIMSFAEDSFREEREGLKQFEIGKKKVALERSEHAYLAVIGQGPIRKPLSTSLRHFLSDVEERYGQTLQRWSGMADDLPGIDAMLDAFARWGRYRRGDWRNAPPADGHGSDGLGTGRPGVPEVFVQEGPIRPRP